MSMESSCFYGLRTTIACYLGEKEEDGETLPLDAVGNHVLFVGEVKGSPVTVLDPMLSFLAYADVVVASIADEGLEVVGRGGSEHGFKNGLDSEGRRHRGHMNETDHEDGGCALNGFSIIQQYCKEYVVLTLLRVPLFSQSSQVQFCSLLFKSSCFSSTFCSPIGVSGESTICDTTAG